MNKIERRAFIKGASTISAFSILQPSIVFGSRVNSAIRMGIIGCGGRGVAVISEMSRNTNIHIIAMADLFDDQLQKARPLLNDLNKKKGLSDIHSSNLYIGSTAYQRLLANKDIDAVLISSPSYTHPTFLEAAVAAGKHVYCEKPAAPDVYGCKKVQLIGDTHHGRTSIVFGFQVKLATAYAEMIKRIHAGQIGDVVNGQLFYLASKIGLRPYKDITYNEAKVRNHYHFKELCGGILTEQAIHILDACNATLKSQPLEAVGFGNAKGGEEWGNTWTNNQILYRYPNDITVSLHATQLGNTWGDVCARFIGTKGIAEAHYTGGVYITGEDPWDSGIARNAAQLTREQQLAGTFSSSLHDADTNRGKDFIASIETKKYKNEARSCATSTLTAILGRQAAENNESVTWDEMLNSNERLEWGVDLSKLDK